MVTVELDGLAALVNSAAATVIGLMLTDGWEEAKEKIVRWRRNTPGGGRDVGPELDMARGELFGAIHAGADPGDVGPVLQEELVGRLCQLLGSDEHGARTLGAELAEMVDRPAEPKPTGSVQRACTAGSESPVVQAGDQATIVINAEMPRRA